VHLVGFTIEIYHDARPYKRQVREELEILGLGTRIILKCTSKPE